MFSKYIIAAAAAFSLIVPTSALYDPSSPANLAMYWGQGNSQQELSYFCNQSTVDIIPIGFVDYFPQQTSGGLPGANYGNACWGTPTFPGSDGHLYERCPSLQEDIPYCQAKGKKILLSIGGGVLTYQLTTQAAGTAFANQLWQMYGPYNATYVALGGIRPLDGGYNGDKTDPAYWIDIDGFDFDIELASTDNAVGYIAMLTQLRKLFLTNPCKKYLITGSPQCSVPDIAMGAMIQAVAFDALWVQFYNTKACSARTWVGGNDALNSTNGKNATAGFTYDNWVSTTAAGASKDAKIYIGLLGGPAGSANHPGDFLWPKEATNLINTYVKDTRFGGVMLWEATVADEEFVTTKTGSVNYYNFIKSILKSYAPTTTPPISTGSICFSTTTSSTSTSKTSTTTTSKSSTTTTTSKTSTSTSSSSSKTTSSTTSKPTSSSTTSTASSYVTSSPTSSSVSSTSSSSSSSVSSSPTSSSVSSTSTSSSSSIYSTLSPTSSPSSTSATSTSSSSSSTSSAPTSLPSDCKFEGCWTEGDGVRALPALSYVDYELMSKEICYTFCVTNHGYPLFGLEYGGECWCGEAVDQTSQNVDVSECSMPCGGYPNEFCGNGNRLDVYYCGTGTPPLPTSSQSSSAAATSTSVTSTSESSASVTPTSSPTSSESSSPSTTSGSSTSSAEGVTTSESSSAAASSSSSSCTTTTESSSTPSVSPTNSAAASSSSTTSSAAGVTTSESSSAAASSSSSSCTTTSESSTSSAGGVTTSESSSTPSVSPTNSAAASSSTSSCTTTSETGTSSEAPTSSPTPTLSSSSYSNSGTSAPTSSSPGSSAASSSTGVTTGPSSTPSVSPSSSGYSSSPSSSVILSTGSSGPTSLSGTTSSTVTPPPYNTTVTPTSSPSGASSSSGVLTTASTKSSTGVVSTPSITTGSSGVVTTPSPSSTSQHGHSHGGHGHSHSHPPHHTTPYTTSTVYSTKVYTITSCAPTVTNCPGRLGQVTTEIISLYTTVCPVTETEGSGGETTPTSTPIAPPASVTPYTTSTVYTTKIYTITSCAPTVTNCPAKLGQVTTEVISLYTTVCPVTEAEATSTPAAPAIPGAGYQASSAGVEESSYSTTTLSSTVTQYRTVKVVMSTATVVPTPSAPYPTGPASSGGVIGTGAGLPSMSLVFISPSPSTVAESGKTSSAGGVAATPTPSTFTGSAGKMGPGSMIAVVLAAIVALIF